MANFGTTNIVDPMATPTAGGIFYLNRPSPRDANHVIDDGWTVQVRRGSQTVIARGGAETSYQDALLKAMRMAQQGLDLFSILGIVDLATTEAGNEHIAWWVEPNGVILRIHENSYLGFQLSMSLTVTDASGKPLPTPPPPNYTWDNSYRYFRLSQTTDDLYDAYRNLFLALESILSIVPKRSGHPPESEKNWLKRALQAAAIDLRRFVPACTTDPEDWLIRDLYESKRTALFHAKRNWRVFLPQDFSERSELMTSLDRLANLYLALVESQFNVRRGRNSISISQDIFEGMAQAITGLGVTDNTDDLIEGDQFVNMEGRRLIPLTCRWATELDDPDTKNLLGSLQVAQMGKPEVINQIVVYTSNSVPGGVARLRETLTLEGIDRVEVQLSQRLRMEGPKKYYGL